MPAGPAGGSLPDREVFSLLAARWSCLGGVVGFRGAAGAVDSSVGAAVVGLDAAVIGLDSYTGDAHRPKASEKLKIAVELRTMQLRHECCASLCGGAFAAAHKVDLHLVLQVRVKSNV